MVAHVPREGNDAALVGRSGSVEGRRDICAQVAEQQLGLEFFWSESGAVLCDRGICGCLDSFLCSSNSACPSTQPSSPETGQS